MKPFDTFTIHPIDIDFAGWSLVPEGQHNSWGIVHDPTQTLRAHYPDKTEAEQKLTQLNKF